MRPCSFCHSECIVNYLRASFSKIRQRKQQIHMHSNMVKRMPALKYTLMGNRGMDFDMKVFSREMTAFHRVLFLSIEALEGSLWIIPICSSICRIIIERFGSVPNERNKIVGTVWFVSDDPMMRKVILFRGVQMVKGWWIIRVEEERNLKIIAFMMATKFP